MYQFFLPLFICLVLSTAIAYAEDASTTATTTPTEVSPVTPAPKIATSEAVLSKTAQNRLTNLAANMSNRMDATASRLQNVVGRLNSRLQKMTDAGHDVSKARTSIGVAQTNLDRAKKNMSTIDLEVSAFIGSTHPRDYWNDLRFIYIDTKDALTAAHTEIITALTIAQELEKSGVTSTSTEANP
jgi:hypothetical protein